MTHRISRLLLGGSILALCFVLSGCDAQIDESILTAEADYSIDIALPYATVTPPPAAKEEAQALVIDAQGSVTVNDSTSILQGEVSAVEEAQSNYKSLRQGNTGLAVQALQTRLLELGYYTAGVSGIFDGETEAAVRRFEQTYGTMQTGVATAELQARLFDADALIYGSDAYNKAVIAQYKVLERGDVGSSVYALQQRLKNLGYPINELTGIFDNETANAVMLFYEAYGLTASDVANVALQQEIYSDSARSYSGAELPASGGISLDSVADIQQRLIDLGYMGGEANGELDARTELAVKLFEEACGRLPSGTLSAELQAILETDYAPDFESLAAPYSNLIEGSSGEEVLRLQERLVFLGFAAGTPNGEFGSATTASIRLFQNYNGLDETGVASKYVQTILFSSFALNIDGETMQNLQPEVIETSVDPSAAEISMEDTPETTDDSAVPGRMAVGDSSDTVLQLQNRLTELGYVTSITGEFDNLTSRAVSALQTAIGLEPTGAVDSDLLAFIYSDAVPRSGIVYSEETIAYQSLDLGAVGDDVDELQARLRKLGYLTKKQINASDGAYDETTRQAIIEIQTKLNFANADGIASPALQAFIHSEAGDALEKDD